jgi:phospholipase C
LPYAFEVTGQARPEGLALTLANTGAAGAALELRGAHGDEPRFYTVEAGKRLEDLAPTAGRYDLTLRGPNGFLRGFRGETGAPAPEASARFEPRTGRLLVTLRNAGATPLTLDVAANAYLKAPPRRHRLAPGAEVTDAWDLKPSRNWYDLIVTCAEASGFQRRLAGHGEDGKPSVSDPLLGRPA